jgi:hypothetical protein
MKKARLPYRPRPGATADNLPADRGVTVGRYTFTPATAYSSPETAVGVRHGDGVPVEPQVTESLLSEFLTLLDAAQEELSRRWNDQGRPGRHASRT